MTFCLASFSGSHRTENKKQNSFTSSTKAQYFSGPYCISSLILQLFQWLWPFTYVCVHEGCVCVCVCVFFLSSSNSLSSSPPLYILFLVHEMILLSFLSTHPSGLLTKWHLLRPLDTKYVLCCSLHQTQSFRSWLSALVILYSLVCLFIWYLSSLR